MTGNTPETRLYSLEVESRQYTGVEDPSVAGLDELQQPEPHNEDTKDS